MSDKFFPIKTETACQLKWAWTTLYLNSGHSASCHRTAHYPLTQENFNNFHNNDVVLADRQNMLKGQWPETSCGYCKNIEVAGGTSDRMLQLGIPNLAPPELEFDLNAVKVSPTILEIFFNNTCNLGCVYCSPDLSSAIANENKKFGDFSEHGVTLISVDKHYNDLVPHFWKWFETGFSTLKRLNILGGEPLYQPELDQLLDHIDANPNPNCELNIVTNLMVSTERLQSFIDRAKTLLANKKIKRIDVTCSIDCWGPEQEYVRWGLKLNQWEENFKLLMSYKWIYLNINQTISALTVKTMPELLIKLSSWREQRKIGHWFSGVTPHPSYLMANIFGRQEFAESADYILKLMPTTTDEEQTAYNYMNGIFSEILTDNINIPEIVKLITYLDEKDRRRGTNWETLFPWLIRYRKYVV
jgi:pyruvate-formate lyase-activating enzyme